MVRARFDRATWVIILRREGFRRVRIYKGFEEYLLVAKDRPYVTHYVRQPDGSWLRSDIEGIESEIELVTIQCKITLREIYAFVEFSAVGE